MLDVRLREAEGYADGFLKAPLVYLPHSCDQWIIGGPDHARQLIADLEEAITQMEHEALRGQPKA